MFESLIDKNAGLYHSASSSVIISSRIRLARNLSGVNFMSIAKKDDLNDIYTRTFLALKKYKKLKNIKSLDMSQLSEIDRLVLLECRFISKELFENKNGRAGLVLDEKFSSLIMLNEEDHLRIQSIDKGLSLEKIWERTFELDAFLAKELNYAYSDRYGFLTSCPSNVGTGMRASVMMHLPCLVESDLMEKVMRGVNQLGIVIRGANGEGSDSLGSFFQVSNQRTLGISEEQIVLDITKIALKLEEFELDARVKMIKETPEFLINKISRAWGLLMYSTLINSSEALGCLSMLKLASAMGIFPKTMKKDINALMMNIQKAHLILIKNCEIESPYQRDVARASYIRTILAKYKFPTTLTKFLNR